MYRICTHPNPVCTGKRGESGRRREQRTTKRQYRTSLDTYWWAIIRLLVRQAQNNHTGLTKVVLKYGLYIDIWAVGFTNHYIYVKWGGFAY